MNILVTGADGFVGSWLVPQLLRDGHEVVAGLLPTAAMEVQERRREMLEGARVVALDLRDEGSVRSAVGEGWDAVIHLAAAASGAEAQRHPTIAWEINTIGTMRLANALGAKSAGDEGPLFLFVSSGEVYGAGTETPRLETDPACPVSSYAASKLAAEIAVREVHLRTGLPVIVARPFPHTGAGQDDRFVVPAFAKRILKAKAQTESSIRVGNLSPVRDFLHVSDVVGAYRSLLERGRPGEVYNIASGVPVSVRELLCLVADAADHAITPEVDTELVRKADVPFLVGDNTKLTEHTGWQPKISLEQTLREVVDAQTN